MSTTITSNRFRLLEFWPLALVLFVGLLLRVYALEAHTMLFDEAFVAVGARDILYNHTPMWDAISNAPFVWLVAQFISIFGETPVTFRICAALAGTVTIGVTYALAMRLYRDKRIATLAAALIAIHPFAIAFSRILFADPFQVMFILAGIYALDVYILEPRKEQSRNQRLLRAVFVVVLWSLAFLAKYNAVVPCAMWLGAGLASGRYPPMRTIVAGLLALLGSLLTLSLWPFDAPVWLFAYLEKGGAYDITFAKSYYLQKLELLFFGLGPFAIIGSIVLGYTDRRQRRLLQASLFTVLYVVTIIILGRRFERYLLVLAPFTAMIAAPLAMYLWDRVRHPLLPIFRYLAGIVLAGMTAIYCFGNYAEAKNYLAYLSNDIHLDSIARDARDLESTHHNVFFLLPEPIGAYYMGFTQFYSRATRPGLDGARGNATYFEYSPRPYSAENQTYGVLAARKMLRAKGLSAILHPSEAARKLRAIRSQIRAEQPIASVDYLDSNFVRSGDALIIVTGVRDVQGEPVLEAPDLNGPPPTITRLPLAKYTLLKSYGPSGITPSDTTVDPIRAGGWVLIRK